MKTFLKIFASVLLIFNGAGAVYGGWNLIVHPDGSSIDLSISLLKNTPFEDYFVPGIILFVLNGLCSFFVLGVLLLRVEKYSWFIIAQGVILTGWIGIQMMMIRMIYFLQIILGSTGLFLILTGLLLTFIDVPELKKGKR